MMNVKEPKLLEEFERSLDDILKNAKELKRISCNEIQNHVFEDLHIKQESSIKEFMKTNALIEDAYGYLWKKQFPIYRERTQNKLDDIKNIYDNFIRNLTIRKKLMQEEIQKLNKSKQSLALLKSFYGTPQEKRKKKRNFQVNMLL